MKRCPKCETEKPDVEFLPKTGKGRLRAYCHPCWTQYGRERRQANPEKFREYKRGWEQRNWDKAKRQMYEWRKKNPEKVKEISKRWREKYLNDYMRDKRQKNRDAVFAHYGERCACCGEGERLFLTIDHVANDGAAHRRSLPGLIGKGGSSFFDWLVRQGFPKGFQTLCRNCNWGKHANGGVCPHQVTEGSSTRAEARRTEWSEARGILGMGL